MTMYYMSLDDSSESLLNQGSSSEYSNSQVYANILLKDPVVELKLHLDSTAISNHIKNLLVQVEEVNEVLQDYNSGKYTTWENFVKKNAKGK